MGTDPGLFGRPLDHRSRPRPTEAISDGYRDRCTCHGQGWRLVDGAPRRCVCREATVELPCGATVPADSPQAHACPCREADHG